MCFSQVHFLVTDCFSIMWSKINSFVSYYIYICPFQIKIRSKFKFNFGMAQVEDVFSFCVSPSPHLFLPSCKSTARHTESCVHNLCTVINCKDTRTVSDKKEKYCSPYVRDVFYDSTSINLKEKRAATSHEQEVSMDAWHFSGMAKTFYATQTPLCINYNKIKRSPLTKINISSISWAKDLLKPRPVNTNPIPDSC